MPPRGHPRTSVPVTVAPFRSQLPVADLFAEEYLTYHQVLPLELLDGRLKVAIAGAPDPEVLDDLVATYGAELDR